jgi:hypothetical protein
MQKTSFPQLNVASLSPDVTAAVERSVFVGISFL